MFCPVAERDDYLYPVIIFALVLMRKVLRIIKLSWRGNQTLVPSAPRSFFFPGSDFCIPTKYN